MPSIYHVPKERRYWVVRAEGGDYFQHFVQHEVIAIGHLDDLGLPFAEGRFNPNWPKLYEAFHRRALTDSKSSRQATSRFNQVRRFVDEINIDDWVITVGPATIRVGRVVGETTYESRDLILRGVGDVEVPMPYKLRRRVAWGPAVRKDRLSAPLLRSLRANQTIFNVDAFWEGVCHTVLPVFARDDNLYFTVRINSSERIRSIDVSNLLLFLNELEVIAKEHVALARDHRRFDERFESYELHNQLTLTTEAEFHSPGEIWGMVSGLLSGGIGWGSVFLLGYAMLFGNSKLGFDGLLDLHTRQKIWDLILERYKLRRIKKAAQRLETSAPTESLKNLIGDESSGQGSS